MVSAKEKSKIQDKEGMKENANDREKNKKSRSRPCHRPDLMILLFSFTHSPPLVWFQIVCLYSMMLEMFVKLPGQNPDRGRQRSWAYHHSWRKDWFNFQGRYTTHMIAGIYILARRTWKKEGKRGEKKKTKKRVIKHTLKYLNEA